MGEAKLKRDAETRDAVVRQALAAVSTVVASDYPSVQFLCLDTRRIDEARARLGSLPSNIERLLFQHGQEGQLPAGVLWWRTPDGFEEATAISSVGTEAQRCLIQFVQAGALSRGYGWRLANFLSDAFGRLAEHAKEVTETEVLTYCAETATEQPLRHASIPGMECYEVQHSSDSARWDRQASLLVRAFDRLSATRRSFEENYGGVSVSFSGHEADPREIFEIEQGAAVIKRVVAAVGHWRWFVRPEETVLWTGALFATGKASVNTRRELSFPVDLAAAIESMRNESFCLTNAALSVGIDVLSPTFTERCEKVAKTLAGILRMLESRQLALKDGRDTLITPEDLAKGQPRPEAAQINLESVCTVLDRSELGKTGLKALLGSTKAFPPAHVKDALRAWDAGGAAMALVRKDQATGQDWDVESIADEGESLTKAVDALLLASIRRKESLSWQLLVSKDMRARLTESTGPALQRLMKASGFQAHLITPEHPAVH